ncbi:GntR family transcriptional regulator [Paenibacillus alkaliterrae]|uniref:GntR family transcriptional regulator n=1 Tax=Paenibacillus alkaliterrae TaxID=320909 RepID=UPI001F2DBEA8|nr:GntR family transcriptional regulator [Paenibacillus alkaliterrae]MCF2938028.1 GntR family transcriptional regulator [Paenibacillus alkaliterrae]
MILSRKKRPLYLQIKNIIKDRILHGVYPIETNIPSEPQLETEFEVSKITVRNAIKELVQEGYLETNSGKGTKVIRNTSASKLSTWKRFTEILVEEGHRIQKQLLRMEAVVNEEGTEPYRLFGEQCLRLERLYLLNDAPYIHYTHYLTMRRGDIELTDLNAQSLYGMFEERQISLANFRDRFAVAFAPSSVESILRVDEKTPLLKRSRYSYDETGEIIEFSVGYYNTEMQTYIVNYDV